MCKLNSSKLRAAGVTAFEIEILKYITDNNITPGTTFTGAPGHPRYGTSKQQVTVYRNDADVIEFGRATASGEIKRTINVAEYGGGRKATTNTNTNTNNDKNNNNMDTTTTATTATTNTAQAAGLDVLNSLFAQQQKIGYDAAKQESAALIADLEEKIKGLQDKGTGTVINVTINGETKCVAEWCETISISEFTIYWWIREKGREYAEKRVSEAIAAWNRRVGEE